MDTHAENDKTICPFLLAASFSGLVQFTGSHIKNGVLYWEFSPGDKVLTLINQFQTKTEPHLPAKDLFDAIETFWKQINELRNGEIRDEKI